MRAATLAILVSITCVSPAEARLFWQTYGATVPLDGGGCAWNVNQDYFVPRHCDSCRYDLFSACKTSHTTSAACANLHPIYGGYCTPYASCRYKWRDHLYKERCGCTPLADCFGPWHLDKCRKHCLALRDHGTTCGANDCGECGWAGVPSSFGWLGMENEAVAAGNLLPNVEPLEGELLGSVPAFPNVAGRGAMPGGGGTAMPTAGAAVGGLPLPGLGSTAPRASTGVVSVPLAPGY